VDFVHDDRADGLENGAALLRREQDVERFWRGDQDVRRVPQHRLARGHQRVARADGRADFREVEAALTAQTNDLGERAVEVLLDVVAERLERRDVQDFGAVHQRAVDGLLDEPIDAREKRRERLAGSGRRRDQRAAPGQDVRPSHGLRFGRRREPLDEPIAYERVRPLETVRRADGVAHRRLGKPHS